MNSDGPSINLGLEIHRRRGTLAALVLLGGMVCLMLYRNLAGAVHPGQAG